MGPGTPLPRDRISADSRSRPRGCRGPIESPEAPSRSCPGERGCPAPPAALRHAGIETGAGAPLPKLLPALAAGHSRAHGGVGHGGGDRRHHARVEHRRGDVLLAQLAVGDDTGEGVRGGELHLVVHPARAHVEQAAEDAREPARVVDLVGVVRPPRGHDADVARGLLGHDLGRRVGHGEDDRLAVHLAEVVHRDHAGAGETDEDVGAHQGVARRAAEVVGVRVVGEPGLHRVHVLRPAPVQRAGAVARDDVSRALQHEELGRRDGARARAGEDDLHLVELLVDDLERVDERGERHHRRPVLVVVEDRDVQIALQALLDLEAARGGDVLEVHPAEDRRDVLDRAHDLVDVLRGEREGKRIDAGERLEDEALPLHHGDRGSGADVAEAQHRRAVGDDGHRVLLDREVVDLLRLVVDGHAHARHAGRVRHREIVARLHRDPAIDLDLPAEVHQERAVGHVDHRDAFDPP